MKAHELLSDESKLCRNNYAVGPTTPPVFTNPGIGPTGTCAAVKWDISGAIYRCYQDKPTEIEKHMTTIQTSQRIHEWCQAFLKGLSKDEYNKVKKNYGAEWPMFNDFAAFNEIHGLLKILDI